MPYVNIRVTDESVTAAQKAELIAGVTELLHRVLAKDPAVTHVVIDEVPPANWGVAGLPVEQYRRRGAG
jgi:4-oxalocrotonate tautomerase